MEDGLTIDASVLRTWVGNVFESQRFSVEDAASVSAALVDADLRGIATHGVVQISGYLDLLRRGVLNPIPRVQIEERGSLIMVDADCGLGHVVGMRVIAKAIAIASRMGCAIVVISQIGHLGALGYFTRRAAENDMVALLMQNGPPLMAMSGSDRRAIGNNPFSFAAPIAGRPPLVLDMATSEVAYGKIVQALLTGDAIPEGWALDKKGTPTRDPRGAEKGILLPLGGFKGIGMAMMVDVLAGSLSGTRPRPDHEIFGAFLMVVDPRSCRGQYVFDSDVKTWLGIYEASGSDVRYPGRRAAESFEQKSDKGIPLSKVLQENLVSVGELVGMPFPTGFASKRNDK